MTKKARDRIVIVGASHAGVSVAETLRQLGHEGEILLLSEEECLPYHRPVLSKEPNLANLPENRKFLRSAQQYAEKQIDIRCNTQIVGINRATKSLSCADGGTISYDRLVLATGARARQLPQDMVVGQAPLYLRNMDDAVALRGAFASAQSILIIGGGLIGLEIAALARAQNIDATIVEAQTVLMGRFATQPIAEHLLRLHEKNGTRFCLGTPLEKLVGDERGYTAHLANHEPVFADIALVAIGTEPNVVLAGQAGLEVDNGIAVSWRGETADPAIFAAGDCANWGSANSENGIRFEAVQPAQEQAKIVASQLCLTPPKQMVIPRYWSQQGAWRVQAAGELGGYDDVDIETGANGALTVKMRKSGRVIGCQTVNDPAGFRDGLKLIEAVFEENSQTQ